ncbi:MAG TPA: tRNA (adenosine(37)-N6)-threonylcarbamoyltransferase complex dimerization subunit type 1 TsaB [Steroidobacteraceae bacterium]|nr:tRNA (adenosine(37)-N6)-threonylcarbamoyltransferase complex dimerization subunit type 1 TsaB [Steroidobacteraceae bacterium]
MKLLAIDTATEQCSAALLIDGAIRSRLLPTARGHADTILPMIDALLMEQGCKVRDLDCLAFGRGPGSFTGVRIAVSVIQGLALATRVPVVGVSNLAAVARQAAVTLELKAAQRILVCMDARMHETYWATYTVLPDGMVEIEGEEQLGGPDSVVMCGRYAAAVGTAWGAHPELMQRLAKEQCAPVPMSMLPRAIEVAELGAAAYSAGAGVNAADAQPVYLRDNVVAVSR